MTNYRFNTSNRTARWAGILYLLLIPLGFFGWLYIPSLLEPGDMATTVSNVAASEGLFRLSMVSVLLMDVVAMGLALALYELFESVSKSMARLMMVLLLLGVGISMLNEVSHFAVLELSGAATVAPFTAAQSHYLVQLFLDLHEFGAYIAAVFWGLWLFPLSVLIIRSNALPKILGILLMIAGVGYLVDSFVLFLAPEHATGLASFTFIGEVLFPLWLLIKGVNVEGESAPPVLSNSSG